MAEARGDWVMFKGECMVRASEVCHVYVATIPQPPPAAPKERVSLSLKTGNSAWVDEPYDDVMKAILEARGE